MSSARRISRRAARLSSPATSAICWSTVSAGEAGGSTAISFGSVRKPSRELADFGRHGGGEEQGLALARQQAHNPLDIRDEAHIQHAVGFVDHEHLDIAEQHPAPLEEVDQPAGRGDQHIDAASERLFLIDEALTADQQRGGQPVVLAVALETLAHLRREFPRRLQDERTRHPRPRPPGGEHVDHRQGETGGLAGARLCATQHVAPCEHDGDRLFLYRRRLGVTGVLDRFERIVAQPKILESHAFCRIVSHQIELLQSLMLSRRNVKDSRRFPSLRARFCGKAECRRGAPARPPAPPGERYEMSWKWDGRLPLTAVGDR